MRIINLIRNLVPSARYASLLEKHLTDRIDILDHKLEYMFWLTQQVLAKGEDGFRKEIFLNMPKATGMARKVQLGNNYILQRIKDICEKNNLQFFLLYGTLLGAVRHSGFIPWDDDIDIGMMRCDYLKLKEILKNDKELSLENYYSKLRTMIPKVKFRESEVFFVDIFPFESFDANEENKQSRWQEYKQCLVSVNRQMVMKLSEDKKFAHAPIPYRDLQADNMLDSLIQQSYSKLPFYGHGEYVCLSLDNYYLDHDGMGLVKKSMVFPLQKDKTLFEGVSYDCLGQTEALLTKWYGNYYQLPQSLLLTHSSETGRYSEKEEQLLMKIGII